MSDISSEGIKTSTFDTWAKTEPKQSSTVKVVQVSVDHRAATRQAIIVDLRKQGLNFKTRSDWHAKAAKVSLDPDWNYKAIAIHHAGNSYSCGADATDQLRKAEATDIASFGQLSYHYAIDCQGIIYEALDIRNKGAHIEGGNSGVIGIVFLADLSIPGEAGQHGPGANNVKRTKGWYSGMKEWVGEQWDSLDNSNDEGTNAQRAAASALIRALKQYFPIRILGGHREFAKIKRTSRPCPGVWGLVVVDVLRQELGLLPP